MQNEITPKTWEVIIQKNPISIDNDNRINNTDQPRKQKKTEIYLRDIEKKVRRIKKNQLRTMEFGFSHTVMNKICDQL